MSDLDSNAPKSGTSAFDRLGALGDGPAKAEPTQPAAPASSRFEGDFAPEPDRAPQGPTARDLAPPTPPTNAPKLTRRGRLRKWDRPKPPMDWRWWVGNLGKTLIATGLLMFGFVAYQLWGTGIETARAQNQLESEFDALLAESTPVVAPDFAPGEGTETAPVPTIVVVDDAGDPLLDAAGQPVTAPDPAGVPTAPSDPDEPFVETAATAPPVPVAQQNIPTLENGDALARLEIPRIGRNDIVVAGVDTGDLKRGPGHFPDTPLPGQLGNSAIAGHRTTYGAPFFNVDDLQPGDEIIATTLSGRYTYRVTGQRIVESNEYWVVATTDPNKATLTLTSCHPKYTAQQRIVIFSELVASESAPVGEPVINYGRPDEPEPDVVAAEPEIPGEPVDDAPAVDAGSNEPTEIEQLDPDQFADEAPVDEPAAAEPTPVDPTDSSGSVTGNLDGAPVAAPAEPTESNADLLGTDEVNAEIADAFSEGWFSDPSANGQVGLWGVALSLVAMAAYAISRKLRRDWAGALIGLLPFVVTLYFFFQNVNRLLPPNL